MPLDVRLDFFPWRLSGTVLGPLLNDPAALAALGDAVHQPPYKAPPKAPVLYVKPRHTLAADGETLVADGVLELGASLAMVIGRPACRVAEAGALDHVAGWTLVADGSVPHAVFYRPSVRFRARDDSCLVGPRVVPRAALDPDAVVIGVDVDGRRVHEGRPAAMQRRAARLLADVSAFMTLHPGDVLMLGVSHGAPQLRPGQRFTIRCDAIGTLAGRVEAGA
jgi:5-oxopent-3-ene-1,2,5-tricarboxylate decarboxylase/2-hydroxyhepta-2,4-diene-1,7-dioate isomerase